MSVMRPALFSAQVLMVLNSLEVLTVTDINFSAHVMNSVSEDPMIQQMNIIRGFIRDARQANRFDEVHILEKNLQDLQEEFKKQHPPIPRTPPSEPNQNTSNNSGYVSFRSPGVVFDEGKKELVPNGSSQSNPFGEGSDDEYDASGKNPFAE